MTNDRDRSTARQFVALIVIGGSVAMALGLTLKMPTFLEANDISRWCTVWSLVERGTYAIDDCPWQARTQDKVKKPDKLDPPGESASIVKRLEYAIAPGSWKEGEPVERFYSSKPPLLPTVIAGLVYPFRVATGVPLDHAVEEPRYPRSVQKPIEGRPGKTEFVMETPKEPVKWPAYVLYLKPMVILLNVVPMAFFLVAFARFLDRHAENDWAWFFGLFAAAWGTLLFVFQQTLNNHTVAAYCAFFALIAFLRIEEGSRSPRHFALAGLFAALCACNELPAALFGLALFGMMMTRDARRTSLFFVPAAAVPIVAFLTTQFIAFGQFKPVYEEFGTKVYTYEGSYWNTPLEMDYLNKEPESYPVYLWHMTFGHHGVFSLTPIFLFSLYGMVRVLRGRTSLRGLAWLSASLTSAMIAFYLWNPKARNYGGSTQGLRWLFWLVPFWLLMLPPGVAAGQDRTGVRRLALAALLVSVISVGYAMRSPWSHPWVLDAMEHLGWYHLRR